MTEPQDQPVDQPKQVSQSPRRALPNWLIGLVWGTALLSAGFAAYLLWQPNTITLARRPATQPVSRVTPVIPTASPNIDVPLTGFPTQTTIQGVARRAMLHTIIPSRPRQDAIQYTVQIGDSVFGIADKFNIDPETLLWANYDQLNDNPDLLSKGMKLNIPPIDGVYYQWQEGDSLESVAQQFDATQEDIINWPGNHLDLTNPVIQPDTWVMVPNGHREFRQWLVPTIPRGVSGVSRSVYGPGACEGGYSGAFGTGTFIWPAGNHYLSGNDYWSGHLGIDIAAGLGAPIAASDSGVVVFAGWSNVGYGNMVMIDHGNGYQTLYGHLSQYNVVCGQSVYQGQLVGLAGSTGNSSGPHLHFEVRYMAGFVSPWFVLPAP